MMDGETHWKHGGIVGVFGYGGGVIGRYSDLQEKFPSIAHFHTMRVNQPASKFYTSDYLRSLCDLWEYRGQRHDEHARFHRRHHLSRDLYRAAGAHLL